MCLTIHTNFLKNSILENFPKSKEFFFFFFSIVTSSKTSAQELIVYMRWLVHRG